MTLQFEQELHPLLNIRPQLQVVVAESEDMSKNGSDANLQPILADVHQRGHEMEDFLLDSDLPGERQEIKKFFKMVLIASCFVFSFDDGKQEQESWPGLPPGRSACQTYSEA
jgi:hypothetical protein